MAEQNGKGKEPVVESPKPKTGFWGPRPTIEQLMAEQGTGPILDASTLRGDFWPEDESIEEFLKDLRESRGHKPIDTVR